MGFLRSGWGKLAIVAGAVALMLASVGAVAAFGPGDGKGERGPGPRGGMWAGDRGAPPGPGDDEGGPGWHRGMGPGPRGSHRGQPPGDERGKNGAVQGTIAALDATAKSVTIARKGNASDTVTVKLTDDTKLRRDGKEATFDQLKVGDWAVAVYEKESGQAKGLNVRTEQPERAKLAAVRGTIAALDSAAKSVTITKMGDTSENVTVKVTDSTKLKRDGKDATFDQLEVGDWAQAVYEKESGQAKNLSAFAEAPLRARYGTAVGTISALDPSAKTVTIAMGRNQEHEVTVKVADDTRLIKGGPTTFDQLAVGDRVLAVYEREGTKALLFIAHTPSAQGQQTGATSGTTQV